MTGIRHVMFVVLPVSQILPEIVHDQGCVLNVPIPIIGRAKLATGIEDNACC